MNKYTKFLLIIGLLLAFPIMTRAATISVELGQLKYRINTSINEAEVMGPASLPIVDLVIPDYIEYDNIQYPVTSIGNKAFENCTDLTGSLTIGNNVTSIGYSAFKGCSGFTGSLNIPEGVTSIGFSAFEGCSGFDGTLTIHKNITKIENSTFKNCSGLTGSLNIPKGVTSIGISAFEGCSGFTGSLTIGNSVTTIGGRAFEYCSGFDGTLTIPKNITKIEDFTFADCSGLTGPLNIPEGVTSIGRSAFNDCSGLTGSLLIPENVNSIGSFAFYGCSGFTGSLKIPDEVSIIELCSFKGCNGFSGSLILPEKVSSIETQAFCDCSGFTGSLIIPDNVTSIGASAFKGCRGFTGALILPEKLTSIEYQAFCDCRGFTGSLIIPENVNSIGGFAFMNCLGFTGSLIIPDNVNSISQLAFYGCNGFTGGLTIGKNVTSIGNSAFEGCSGFTDSLIIPHNVTSIGTRAFFGCRGFTGSLTIGENVSSISNSAFKYCSGFTGALILPENITLIGTEAFRGCNGFESLSLPLTITSIGYQAFEEISFKDIEIKAIVPPTCETYKDKLGSFYNKCYSLSTLYVPAESIEAYKTAPEWEKFKNINPITVPATCIVLNKSELETLVGDSFLLKATITPENAIQEVQWGSSDTTVATVSNNGKVDVVGYGSAVITASTTDGSDLSATCELTAWLRGDSNGDNMVNVADVVNCINYIAGNSIDKFIFIATDVNENKDITVTDATMIAQLILNANPSTNSMLRSAPIVKSRVNGSENYLNVTDNGSLVTLAMSNTGYTAFQSEIVIPEGAELSGIRLVNAAKASHTLMSSVSGNRVKVIVFSVDNIEIKGNEPFVELTLNRNFANTGTIAVEEAIVSDKSARPYTINAKINGESSGVRSIDKSTEINIEALSEGVFIRGGMNMPVSIHNIDGMLIHTGNCASENEYISLNKGIYIVKVGDKVKPIFVR